MQDKLLSSTCTRVSLEGKEIDTHIIGMMPYNNTSDNEEVDKQHPWDCHQTVRLAPSIKETSRPRFLSNFTVNFVWQHESKWDQDVVGVTCFGRRRKSWFLAHLWGNFNLLKDLRCCKSFLVHLSSFFWWWHGITVMSHTCPKDSFP